RYATKEFDGRKISEEKNLNKILEAIRLAPSSFGIQPYRITVVGNDEIKKNLNSHAFWDQKQIATCSHALVFNDDLDFPKRANDFVALAEREGRDDITNDPEFDYAKEAADYAVRMGVGWATKQTYLALGFAMAACAELKIDSCPMESIDLTSIKKLLGLSDNLEPKVVLAIGYRSPKDLHVKDKKLRFGKEDLFDSKK
ncbi:NAD(P)H-dependent oxidoreductase, partial [Patescibacteria group bacterium]|nr:NAD(P)H-dependent oxidoreductase [Patescibacteria group bacterium]